MAKFSKECFSILVVVVGMLATCNARGQRSYFHRYPQRRQVPEGSWGAPLQSSNNGNFEMTLTIPGASSGCNCACPASSSEPTHEETPAAENLVMPPAGPPSPAPSECGSQNPFCDDPAEGPPAAESTMLPAGPPSPAPSECGTQNPFCDDDHNAPSAPTTVDPESTWSGTLSIKDEFCSHHYNCITCGSQDPSTCAPKDQTSKRGQCYYKWSSDEFFNKHCSEYPKCQTTCEIKK